MTTIGYGDISAITEGEKLYAIFMMIIACGVFAYIVGNVSSIMDGSNTIISEFK